MESPTAAKNEGAKKKTLAIKTPQSLIHIKHRISLLQYKYWILLLRELREQFDSGTPPDENGFRYVSMNKIETAIGYVPNKAEFFKDLLALKNETIAFNVLEKDGQEAKYGAGFISEWKITSQRIAFKFPSVLENVMRGLESPKAIFQQLNWDIFNHFSGKYEAIIYKLCRDYVGVGRTPYMTVQEFRDYMGLKPTEYTPFMKLNEWIIKRPSDRINASDISDVSISPEYERNGRKILGLRFLVTKKNQVTIPFPEFEPNPAFRFSKIHIESNIQAQYLALRAPEEIELCIERANEYADTQEKAGKATNLGAVYRKAIEEGWHVQHAVKKQKKVAIEHAKTQAVQEVKQKRSDEAKELQKSREHTDALIARFDALPDEQKESLRAEYRATLTSAVMLKVFDKDGETAVIHRVAFARFAEQHFNK
jgi:uncharacterized FlaG/YvyC family protein